jgi:hypothetical protein
MPPVDSVATMCTEPWACATDVASISIPLADFPERPLAGMVFLDEFEPHAARIIPTRTIPRLDVMLLGLNGIRSRSVDVVKILDAL